MSAASPTQNREPTELISDDGARGSDSNVGNTSFNVARLLTEMAHAMPNAVAIAEAKHPKCRRRYGEQNLAISHAGYHTASFAWLDADSSAIAAGLREMGIKPGMRIALLVPPGIDFVSLVFALLKLGAVQVLIDPGMGKQNVLRSLAEVRPEGIISVAFVQALRWLLRRKLPDATRNVTVHGYGLFHSQQMFGETLEQLRQRGARQVAGAGLKGSPGEATLGDASLVVARSPDRVTASTEGLRTGVHGRPAVGDCARSGDLRTTEDFQVFAATADAPAAIIFTSGSTGPAKGVLYRHGNFDTQVREIRNFYGIEPGGIDVACFPLFGLFNAAMGVTTVFPNMDFTRPAKVDPRNIVAAITDWQATQSFASPAVWNLVGKHCEVNHIQLPSLRRVFSCGAPVAAHVLRRMKSCIASDGEMFTPYGATEALPVASISASEVVGNDFNHGVAGV
ncbi:MAG TPA: AMP-binding protein, partial [Pirellulales bacterium]